MPCTPALYACPAQVPAIIGSVEQRWLGNGGSLMLSSVASYLACLHTALRHLSSSHSSADDHVQLQWAADAVGHHASVWQELVRLLGLCGTLDEEESERRLPVRALVAWVEQLVQRVAVEAVALQAQTLVGQLLGSPAALIAALQSLALWTLHLQDLHARTSRACYWEGTRLVGPEGAQQARASGSNFVVVFSSTTAVGVQQDFKTDCHYPATFIPTCPLAAAAMHWLMHLGCSQLAAGAAHTQAWEGDWGRGPTGDGAERPPSQGMVRMEGANLAIASVRRLQALQQQQQQAAAGSSGPAGPFCVDHALVTFSSHHCMDTVAAHYHKQVVEDDEARHLPVTMEALGRTSLLACPQVGAAATQRTWHVYRSWPRAHARACSTCAVTVGARVARGRGWRR